MWDGRNAVVVWTDPQQAGVLVYCLILLVYTPTYARDALLVLESGDLEQ
jgi:hypothetical protein